DGQTYNINADFAAAALARALAAQQLLLMTNIPGLLDAEGQVIARATVTDIERLIDAGVIAGGMIPKTRAASATLDRVKQVHIIDGRVAENVIAVLSGQPIGTTLLA
ncbi:MAG: acetylglutamate kinase, partial [Gammaproteobacteria bacterium]